MSSSPGLGARCARIVQVVRTLAPRDVRVRYRQSLLDVAWALISPIVVVIVYGLVLTQSFDVSSACSPYLTSAWTGLVVWTFFATAVGGAVGSLIASSDLITKVYFPREAVPAAMALSALPDLAIGLVTLVALMLIQGVRPGWAAFGALLPLVVLLVWTVAISMLVGVVAAFIRDVVHGVHLALRVGFFATPVMYEASFLPPQLQWSASVNPVAVVITALRSTLLCNEWPDTRLLAIHLVVATALVVVAMMYTRSVESRITDVV